MNKPKKDKLKAWLLDQIDKYEKYEDICLRIHQYHDAEIRQEHRHTLIEVLKQYEEYERINK